MQKKSTQIALMIMVLAGCMLIAPGRGFADPAEGPAETVKATLSPDWIKAFEWRCIGPAVMGGRIVDIAVNEADPSMWWCATASGGLLKTTNNGITFTHQFDRENTVSIGDVAVAPSDPKIVWIGTGEANPRNSVSWGDGIYKSADGGATWKHMGLKASFQIGRIQIHPTDPNIVYVGTLGRLWGPNEERGLYKTTDGGETWERILYVDDKTGVIDVQMSPGDPDTLLVATWERERDGFDSNTPKKPWGPGSGLYKTTDGGKTFRKITEGLPTCQIGRIGLDYYLKDPKIVYAVVESEKIAKEPENAPFMGMRGEDADVGARITEVQEDGSAKKADLKTGDIVVSMDGVIIHSYSDFTKEIRKHQAGDTVKLEVSRDRKSVVIDMAFIKRPEPEEEEQEDQPQRGQRGQRPGGSRSPFSSGLGGQRENIQDQQGKDGHEYGGIYRSEDGGETWTRINSVNPRPMYYSQIRVDPSDNNYMYVLGTSLYRSKDGGATFTSDGGRGVHSDHHGMWVDPKDGRHIILGGDGGLYVTWDRMEKWDHYNHMAIGQFYHVGVGPRPNYKVYGGLQDNGSWGGPSRSRTGSGPINEDWIRIGGGDGFVCRVDEHDPDLVYSASQNGSLSRYNLRTGARGSLRARGERGVRYRYNWKTPYILSSHNSGIYYTAGNVVFRSMYQGQNLKPISPEITNTDQGSATVLGECPFDPNVLYVGTDDGALWRTSNGGNDWKNLFKISEEEASKEGGAERSREGSREGRRGAFQGRDRPGRGEGGGQRRMGGVNMGAMLERLDTDGDGKLTKSEVPERMAQLFERADTNKDGVIDQKEREAMAGRSRGGEQAEEGAAEETAEKSQEETAKAEATEQSQEEKATEVEPPVEQTQEKKAEGAEPQEDPVTGEWKSKAVGEGIPAGEGESTITLKMTPDGKVTGTMSSRMGEGEISSGKFDRATGKLTLSIETEMMSLDVSAKVTKDKMSGTIEMAGGAFSFGIEATRTSKTVAAAGEEEKPSDEDAQYEWKTIDKLLPGPRWVSSIQPSKFKEGRVYVSMDGHKSNDDALYIFVSENHGKTWRSLKGNLPVTAGSTRALREDITNENILYLGTEFAAFVSIDRGKSWTKFNNNLPTVAIHDFAQHPTAGEIVAATHGRSLWIVDVTPLRQLTEENVQEKAILMKPNTVHYWKSEPSRGGTNRRFVGENPTSEAQVFYFLNQQPRSISLRVTDPAGKTLRDLTASTDAGLHRVSWDLRRPAPQGTQASSRRFTGGGGSRRGFGRRGIRVEPGTYMVELKVDNLTLTQPLRVAGDPEYPSTVLWGEEYEEQEAIRGMKE